MVDRLSSEARSRLMSRIRSRDTKPELVVRSLLHRMGYRYRLHRRDLPGTPDIVLPRHRKIIQVQGCFWHGHGCRISSTPKSRREYWVPKIEANKSRDRQNKGRLRHMGWRVLEIWECETGDSRVLASKLARFMKRRARSVGQCNEQE